MSLVKAMILIAMVSCFDDLQEDCIEVSKIEIENALPPIQQTGMASFYGSGKDSEKGMHGKITATGEPFDPKQHTCASRTIPLNTIVIIEEVDSGNKVTCRVNDRGPYGAILHDDTWAAMFYKNGQYVTRSKKSDGWGDYEYHDTKPGKYRGVMDLSIGTANALGFDLDKGMIRINIRYFEPRS